MRGFLYDGSTGVRHEVDVTTESGALHLHYDGAPLETVPVEALSIADRAPAGLTLRRQDYPGWRLKLPAPIDAELDRLFPKSGGYGGWIDRVGLPRALGVFAGVSALVLTVGYFAPTLLAPLVPPSVEKTYGEALVGDFGGKYCTAPQGTAALKRLVAELDARPQELNVRVVDAPIVNAAALPAGNILLFDKLFEVVDSPDELAGILAHEIAHVRRRHVTAALIREFGIGIFASALGGTTAGRVDGFVALSFTRRAEQEADATAIATLKRAGISPAPTAAFFKRLKKAEANVGRFEPALAYLSSHPLSGDRAQRFAAAADPHVRYRPALSSGEWSDLRRICSPGTAAAKR